MSLSQATRARAIFEDYAHTLERMQQVSEVLAELTGECGNTVDGEWERDDGTLYYEARGELRDASSSLADALGSLRMLRISLEHCK